MIIPVEGQGNADPSIPSTSTAAPHPLISIHQPDSISLPSIPSEAEITSQDEAGTPDEAELDLKDSPNPLTLNKVDAFEGTVSSSEEVYASKTESVSPNEAEAMNYLDPNKDELDGLC
jgi:hypothetical protein